MEKGTLKVKFSNGFGNNLFQYVFGRLLAEHHDLNYCHDSIPEMGIKKETYPYNKKLKTIRFKAKSNFEAKKYDRDHYKFFEPTYKNCNFDFNSFMFYFEDYAIYKPYLGKIRSWFKPVKKTNTKDLVIHFRLKNRLVWETHYNNFIKPEIYKKIISSNFKFEKLYIVSDMDKWGDIKNKDIKKIKEETRKKYKKNTTKFVPTEKSVDYMNSLVDNFKEFKPKLYHSDKFVKDFNFIRSFDQILFKNSTFSWWAATLSEASKIGVFRLWKPHKGKEKYKNLGETDFPGWFSWGTTDNLISVPIDF